MFVLVCAHQSEENPFFCLDSCYISALLHDALGFNKSAQLIVSCSAAERTNTLGLEMITIFFTIFKFQRSN